MSSDRALRAVFDFMHKQQPQRAEEFLERVGPQPREFWDLVESSLTMFCKLEDRRRRAMYLLSRVYAAGHCGFSHQRLRALVPWDKQSAQMYRAKTPALSAL